MSGLRAQSIVVVVLAAAGWAAPALAADLGRGSGATVTKAAWTWRITRADADAPCLTAQKPACRTTTMTIENSSAQTMACVAQLRFGFAGETEVSWTENSGLEVEAGAAAVAIESEYPDQIAFDRSFVVCWTLAERDEADSGDAPFARSAPSECKFTLASSPELGDFFPSAARRNDEGGRVRVRIVLPLADGAPKVLGVSEASGFLRIDRAALLLASRMSFKTNCPGTQTILPIRFRLADTAATPPPVVTPPH